MDIKFYKYQGTGNDFIVLDDRELQYENLSGDIIAQLCHRRFGIGADGFMLLRRHPNFDFGMVYHNADGKEGSMCGNGGRCLVQFARDLGLVTRTCTFEAVDGLHEARIEEDGQVSLKMMPVDGITEREGRFVLFTGSPHYVEIGEGVQGADVYSRGRAIRYSPEFEKEGINVNFTERLPDGSLYVRTYERGVEDETYSCGTGVTASALVCAPERDGPGKVTINTKGGKLSVSYVRSGNRFSDIWLTGPALQVFTGQYPLNT